VSQKKKEYERGLPYPRGSFRKFFKEILNAGWGKESENGWTQNRQRNYLLAAKEPSIGNQQHGEVIES